MLHLLGDLFSLKYYIATQIHIDHIGQFELSLRRKYKFDDITSNNNSEADININNHLKMMTFIIITIITIILCYNYCFIILSIIIINVYA